MQKHLMHGNWQCILIFIHSISVFNPFNSETNLLVQKISVFGRARPLPAKATQKRYKGNSLWFIFSMKNFLSILLKHSWMIKLTTLKLPWVWFIKSIETLRIDIQYIHYKDEEKNIKQSYICIEKHLFRFLIWIYMTVLAYK